MSSVNPNVQLDDGIDAGAPVLKWGAAAVAMAGLVDVYGVYGDAQPKADQKAGLPFVLIVAVIAAVVVFGVVVPRALRSMRATSATPGAAGLVLSILGLVLAPVAFWSGIPVVLGAGGSLLGSQGRRSARARGASATRESAAVTIGSWP